MNDELFDPAPYTNLPAGETPATISAGRRRTARNQAELAAGRHPATGYPLAGNGETCATCTHHKARRMGNTYHKCARHQYGITGGPRTDIRTSWPACTLYNDTTEAS